MATLSIMNLVGLRALDNAAGLILVLRKLFPIKNVLDDVSGGRRRGHGGLASRSKSYIPDIDGIAAAWPRSSALDELLHNFWFPTVPTGRLSLSILRSSFSTSDFG
ncbi:hypothetical protein TRIUR3_34983 [Triticum urartu]|uniref:Uncharacterized protein n=1 Tax=Triticum urartu TaxID=4572 RepID=M7Z0Z3_TRIUA|nr:hypothetical protein TRIUR3_34983 [Triticum urartu]